MFYTLCHDRVTFCKTASFLPFFIDIFKKDPFTKLFIVDKYSGFQKTNDKNLVTIFATNNSKK